ncbi:MAG: hypothetical protein JWP12_278 [Bacteroidetes bacterium]|nr:hypothetical protein [Bacteroidota bacterium]
MIRKLFFICLSTALLLSASCKKYDDGGKHYGAPDRIVKNWTFHQFTVNGADSLSKLDPLLRESEVLRVSMPRSGDGFASNPLLQAGFPLYVYTGSLEFEDHKKNIEFAPNTNFNTVNSHTTGYPFGIGNKKWEILEIQKGEVKLRMENSENGKEYIMVWQ